MDTQYYATLNGVQERHWWYVARRKILDRVLARAYAEGVPPGKLYDLGCGVGANLPVLEKYGETLGVDMSSEAVEFCKARGANNVIQANLNSLEGLADESAAVVVLADVIEHLDDEVPCLQAAKRALAPNGVLIVTVPAYMFLWSPADDLNHHKRRYTAGSLKKVISPLFEIEHVSYFNTLLFGAILGGRVVEKMLNRGGDDGAQVPGEPVNGILRRVFELEATVVAGRRLPFGVSILCVARKR